jgi:hypothetical protein
MIKRIIKWGSVCGALAAIVAFAAVLGTDLIPWPAKAQVEALENGQAASVTVQQKLIDRLDRSDRRYWRDIEIQAEAELKLNPDSVSAKRELERARDEIKELDKEASQ